MKPLLTAIACILMMSCSYILITPATPDSKPKLDILTSENCKTRVKLSKQVYACKWKF